MDGRGTLQLPEMCGREIASTGSRAEHFLLSTGPAIITITITVSVMTNDPFGQVQSPNPPVSSVHSPQNVSTSISDCKFKSNLTNL